jgi:hypothetical protein
MEGFKPPRDDLNSPDLYIPGKDFIGLQKRSKKVNPLFCTVMAVVTYVLLCGLSAGLHKK